VATDKTRGCIAALERARAEIETALAGDADWLALRRAAPGSSPLAQELAFAANPLYRSWMHLNEAIGDLQAALPAERRSVAEPVPAPAQRPIVRAEARSIELHHVLRHIRDSAAQTGDRAAPARTAPHEVPTSAATATDDAHGHAAAGAAPLQPEAHQAEAVDGAPDGEDMYVFAPEPEEASVTFVIRDQAPPASGDGEAAQGEATQGEALGGPLADQWATVGAEDCLYAATGDGVEEAEVVILSRPAGRRSRKA
jgi:hypothetical protein